MVKNVIKYIFIYTICVLFVGCDTQSNFMGPSQDSCDYCYLELEAPNLWLDDNGFYHLDFDDESIQTFTQLRAYVGYEYEYVGWTTDTAFDGCTWDYCEDVPIVNGSSYTTEDGYAYQMMGVYEGNIGDIATIWVGYRDNYGKQWFDSIRIMIDE
tara:strand:+ start:153 stop:617 length:465 start_codon:yes stop_codon:yes gene_type:complete